MLDLPNDQRLNDLTRVGELRIRQAQIGDLEAMGQIAGAADYEAPDDLAADGHTVYVALDRSDNDRLSGFIWFLRSAWNPAGFFIRLVMTHQDKQRRGIGSLLMAFATHAMNNAEPETAVSLIVLNNNAAARRWYTALGMPAAHGGVPNDLPADESELEQGEAGQYEYRRNASPIAVSRTAVRNLKLSIAGRLLANQNHNPLRTFEFRRNQEHFVVHFRFWKQQNLMPYNPGNQQKTYILTDFGDLDWNEQGQRQYSCWLDREIVAD